MTERRGNREEVAHDATIGHVDLTRWPTRPGRALAKRVDAASRRIGSHSALVLILAIGALVALALEFRGRPCLRRGDRVRGDRRTRPADPAGGDRGQNARLST